MEVIVENATVEAMKRDENLAKVEIATLAVILIVTVIGNVTVLFALYAKRRTMVKNAFPRMYFFIFHVCLADLISAFFSVLPQLIWDITFRFRGNGFLCKVVKFGQILGPYLSSYILTATAFDRYRAICYPLNYHSWCARQSKTYICYAWLISIAFSIPQVFIFSYEEIAPGVWDCWATFIEPWGDKAYVIWYSTSSFLVPLVCLVFTYTCICRVIWDKAASKLGNHGKLISRAKINTIKQTIAVIAVYIACSSPFIVAQIWASWDPEAFNGPFMSRMYTILVLLATLNSSANPWIFMTFNSELRFTFHMFTGICKESVRSESATRKNSVSESSNDVYILHSNRTLTDISRKTYQNQGKTTEHSIYRGSDGPMEGYIAIDNIMVTAVEKELGVKGRRICNCFVGLEKALDLVDREAQCDELRELGVSTETKYGEGNVGWGENEDHVGKWKNLERILLEQRKNASILAVAFTVRVYT